MPLWPQIPYSQTSHIAQPQLHRCLSVLHNNCKSSSESLCLYGSTERKDEHYYNAVCTLSACCVLKMYCTYLPHLHRVQGLCGVVFSQHPLPSFFLFCSCFINSSIVKVKTSWYFLSLNLLLIQFITTLSVNSLILTLDATKYKYSVIAACKQCASSEDFQKKKI